MFLKILSRLNNSIGGGAILIAFFSIISKFLGLYRDRLLASAFGASQELDVYFAAFKLPDFIFNILILGALTSAFIPIFQKKWLQNQEDGLKLANSALNFFLLIMAGLAIILSVTAPWIVPLLVPGFSPEAIAETVWLTQILTVSLIFFTASNILSGILNSWKKFFTFALSSVVYNLGIIIGIVLLLPQYGLTGVVYGVVFGSFLHFLVQFIEAKKNGWHYQLVLDWTTDLKRILKLMIPRSIGLAGHQVNILVITFIASVLPAGSLAIFNLANNLQSFPIGIFGISLAVSAFPSFTRFVTENNAAGFKNTFSLQFRRILYFLVPISVLLLILRAQIVRVILGTGAFDWEDTILTANALGIFALSIFAQGLIPLASRAFYAHEDTKTPVVISLISIGINVILAFILAPSLGVLGLTLAFTIANIFNLLVLLVSLRAKLGDIDDNNLILSAVKIVSATILAGIATYFALYFLSLVVNMQTFVGVFTQGLVAGVVGVLVYGSLTIMFHFPEVSFVRKYLSKSLKVFKKNDR